MTRALLALALLSLPACAPKSAPPTHATYAAKVHLLRHEGIAAAESILGLPPVPGTQAHVAALQAQLAAPAALTTEGAAAAGRAPARGG
jgi:hypothetical protein